LAGVLFVALDAEGKITLLNRKACEVLECGADEFHGKDWFSSFIPLKKRDSDRRVFDNLIKGLDEAEEYHTNSILTTSGEERLITWHNTPLRNEEGIITGLLSSGEDITERIKAEREMKAASDTAMLYLDLMGHDIRNQMQAILMGKEILESHYYGPDVAPVLSMIVQSVNASQDLIEKAQATRELFTAPMITASLSKSLHKAIKGTKEKHPVVEIEQVIDIDDAFVVVDKHLDYLLEMILENAVLHNPDERKRMWVNASVKDNGYEILIADNGTGMSERKKEWIFDPERRFGGVGMHQAIRLVKKYDGELSVHDRVLGDHNRGAMFKLWLPKKM
jgi:PAS domain S-box-containing protein